MTEQEASDFLALPNKVVIKPFAWSLEASGHSPQFHVFESAIQVDGSVLEGVLFRARYRGAKKIVRGDAEAEAPSSFNCAIFVGGARVAAIDTNPVQRHTNRVGIGRPYFGQLISAWSHRHVWIGEDGYVEPVEPPIMDVLQLIHTFGIECKLTYTGQITHPMRGDQPGLFE